MSTGEWKAGQALRNKEKWLEVVKIVKDAGLPVEHFALQAIHEGEIKLKIYILE